LLTPLWKALNVSIVNLHHCNQCCGAWVSELGTLPVPKAQINFCVRPLLVIFVPEQPDHMWLCARVTLALKVVESCSKAQKT